MRRYFSEEFIYKALFSKKVILVEGIVDYIFIKSFFDYLKYEDYSKNFIELINNTSLIYIVVEKIHLTHILSYYLI